MSVDKLHIDLAKQFGGFTLSVKQSFPLEGVTAVFGPSGSGKSSLLRLIAGLEAPDTGRIQLGQNSLCDTHTRSFIPPHMRNIALVSQDSRLLPHLSIEKNLSYAEKRQRDIGQVGSIADIVEAFDLSGLLNRKPHTLSGGEKQRAALAQALLTSPQLLMLDEPLSALDQARRQDILPHLETLQARFAIPLLYVSHDIAEVSRLADRVLSLRDGKVNGLGPTLDVLNAHGFQTVDGTPKGVLLEGKITSIDETLSLADITIGAHKLRLPLSNRIGIGQAVRIIIYARDVILAKDPIQNISIQNKLKGRVLAIQQNSDPAFIDIAVKIGETRLPVRITKAAREALRLNESDPVYALIKTASLIS